jgi:hypothetical protein
MEFSNLSLFCNLNSFKLINSICFIVELAKSNLFGKAYLIRSFKLESVKYAIDLCLIFLKNFITLIVQTSHSNLNLI